MLGEHAFLFAGRRELLAFESLVREYKVSRVLVGLFGIWEVIWFV